MRGNRSENTIPELRLRKLLHAAGLRYRVHYPVQIAGRVIRVDIAFPRHRLAIFVDGCFWHGCGEHHRPPKTNLDYWTPKIEGNRARDAFQTEALEDGGWKVIRGWEHDPASHIADRVKGALGNLG